MKRIGLIVAVILAAICGLGVVVLVVSRVVLFFLPHDPVGQESAFGRSGGNLRVAIGICPNEYYERLSVYGSMVDDPPPSSLLWEVRDPLNPTPGKREFTIGNRDGFGHETKRLEAKLPKEFQIVYQTNFHTDQFGADLEAFHKLPSGRWYDGNDEVKVSELHTGGCGT